MASTLRLWILVPVARMTTLRIPVTLHLRIQVVLPCCARAYVTRKMLGLRRAVPSDSMRRSGAFATMGSGRTALMEAMCRLLWMQSRNYGRRGISNGFRGLFKMRILHRLKITSHDNSIATGQFMAVTLLPIRYPFLCTCADCFIFSYDGLVASNNQ